MNAEDAYEIIRRKMLTNPGRFYGDAGELDIGSGLIFDGIRFPTYIDDRRVFATVRGTVYVLTHECDVSPENLRPFNDDVVVCPLIPLGDLVSNYLERYDPSQLRGFLENIAIRNVSRMVYFPPLPDRFPYGAMMFLNQVCSTKLEVFELDGAAKVGALSHHGLSEVDFFLQNHFFRPKAQALSFFIH